MHDFRHTEVNNFSTSVRIDLRLIKLFDRILKTI